MIRQQWTRVKRHFRIINGKLVPIRGHKRRTYRKKLSPDYVRAMKELARSPNEYGGEIDLDEKDSSQKMTVYKGKKDEITLHPTGAEVTYHTHPIVDEHGNIIESEARLQRTPSPTDIGIMLYEKWDENWALPTARDFVIYKETDKTPKYSKQLIKDLEKDYHRLEADSYTKFLKVKDPEKRDIKQTEWFSTKWEKLLQDDYHIYVRRFGEHENVIVSGHYK